MGGNQDGGVRSQPAPTILTDPLLSKPETVTPLLHQGKLLFSYSSSHTHLLLPLLLQGLELGLLLSDCLLGSLCLPSRPLAVRDQLCLHLDVYQV